MIAIVWSRPTRFLTVDRWRDVSDFERMKRHGESEYARLDEAFAALTESELAIGVFEEA